MLHHGATVRVVAACLPSREAAEHRIWLATALATGLNAGRTMSAMAVHPASAAKLALPRRHARAAAVAEYLRHRLA